MIIMLSEDKRCGGGCKKCPMGVRMTEDVETQASTVTDQTANRLRRIGLLPEYSDPDILLDIASGLSARLISIIDESGLLTEQKKRITQLGLYFTRDNLWLQKELFLQNYARLFADASTTIIVPNNQKDQAGKTNDYMELINVGIDIVMDPRFIGDSLGIQMNINDIATTEELRGVEILEFEAMFYRMLLQSIKVGKSGEGLAEIVVNKLQLLRTKHAIAFTDIKIEIEKEKGAVSISLMLQIGNYPPIILFGSFGLHPETPVQLTDFVNAPEHSPNPGIQFAGNRVFMVHEPVLAHLPKLWVDGEKFDGIINRAESIGYMPAVLEHLQTSD